ncbi:hypothetical protein [Sphingobacterium sp. GVS05A]|uniref:hypothetical protein n=1 Tax=Sphingobacterium sp. GVS05A TaxID=2862679 RepID=UPI001CBECE39|nr:hypothetical protein [Sphingobacterium sp. GVS05A]
MIKNIKTYHFILSITCLLSTITACKKDIDATIPGNGEAIKINYLANSDVLKQYTTGGVGIFVDTVLHNNTGNLPFFDLTTTPKQVEYPKFFSTVPGLLYINYLAGNHRFQFNYMIPDTITSNFGTKPYKTLVDTTLLFEKDLGSLIYLIDGPVKMASSEPTFKILSIPANRSLKLDSSQVALTISHQSPDTEAIKCSRVTAEGGLTTENLPQKLAYGQSTSYVIFDVKDASNGVIGFRIYRSSNGEELINTGIPANGGHAYVLSISGFQHEQLMNLPSQLNSDNTVQYNSVTIFPNLRATTRQIW